jgi:phosphatidylinositol-3-phosphatase
LTGDGVPGACADCGAGLRPCQRYCLGCGTRIGPRSAQLDELVRRARAWPASSRPARDVSRAAPAPGDSRAGGFAAAGGRPGALLAGLSELTLPSRRISALLVLAFAGFGVLLGNVAGSRVDYTLAASARPRVKLLLASPSSTAAHADPGSAAVEPPSVSAQATPEAALEAVAPARPAAPAATHASPPESGHGNPAGEGGSAPASPAPAAKLPAIKHVFVIMLSDQPYAATFGPQSGASYLSRKLERRGALLARYYAVAHEQLANGIALLSGQGPTPATVANCPVYTYVSPATVGGEEQVAGDGCVYPPTTATLPGQMEVKRLSWRAYVQGVDEPGSTEPACAHPAIGQPDASSAQSTGQQYATSRNPFVYFQGLTESPSCARDDVGLSALSGDLSDSKRTPNLSYIVPDRCHDGSPGPCPGGGTGGLAAADGLLAQIVPWILASAAYRHGGLLLITTGAAPSSGEFADSSSCCGQPRFPNLPPATGVAASLPPEGGGQVGALLLSPLIKRHAISQEPYNHYSLLRTIEDLFGLKHLGYAAGAHVSSLEPSLFAARPSG